MSSNDVKINETGGQPSQNQENSTNKGLELDFIFILMLLFKEF